MINKSIALVAITAAVSVFLLLSPNQAPSAPLTHLSIPPSEINDKTTEIEQATVNTTTSILSPVLDTGVNIERFVPNLQWRDKTEQLNGQTISYRFGDGNPAEVALNPDEYRANGEKDGIPYVTPEAEKILYDLLADPVFPEVLTKCHTFYKKEMQQLNPHINPNDIPALLTSADVDIENYLVIDPITKRKTINADIDNRLNDFFNLLSNPMTGKDFALKCLGRPYLEDVKRLQEKFHALGREYTNTGDAILGQEWPK